MSFAWLPAVLVAQNLSDPALSRQEGSLRERVPKSGWKANPVQTNGFYGVWNP